MTLNEILTVAIVQFCSSSYVFTDVRYACNVLDFQKLFTCFDHLDFFPCFHIVIHCLYGSYP
ncbi:hypothetical protein MAR_028458, partial [Mya arenaria]